MTGPAQGRIPEKGGPERAGSRFELLVVWGDSLQVFELPREGTVTLGRGENNTLRIDHSSISRSHARLQIGAAVWIEDLGSANGTFVAGASEPAAPGRTEQLRRLLTESAELRVGAPLMLGAVSATLRVCTAPDPTRDDGSRPETMREIYAQAARAAQASISVLVLGETGVGKELLARAIHTGSARAKLPFMGINCAALGEGVLEGELFGYERGAFTGAVQARPGLFEAANGGTVFLDEVGELPAATQAKLLRVLEERSVLRIGARATRAVDIRVIAATHRDLEAEVEVGRFRQDLFYRLNAFVLSIPPLRERSEEIPALTREFVAHACQQLSRPSLRLSEAALQLLLGHVWPGNVRELRNVVERAVVLCAGAEIGVEHLPASWSKGRVVAHESSAPAPAAPLGAESFRAQVDSLERSRILDALHSCSGNQTRAAQVLGMSRRTLVNRLDQLGLPRPKKK